MNTLSPSKKKSLTVLIADDDAELREILHAEFELEGVTVITASNGSEAVTSVRRIKPDLVIMDSMMSEMNGIEATRIIKNDDETGHIPIILLIAAGNREDIVEAIEAGATDYITKPFFVPELKARLKAVLQYKIMYDELKRIQDTQTRNVRLQTMKALTEAVQGSINEPLTLIFGKIHLLRRNSGDTSEDDLRTMENAANRIKDIVNHLGIMECLYPAPLLHGGDVIDLPFPN